MGNKLYKPKNKRKKENLKMIDKLEISGVTIAAIALLGWSGYSIANTFIPQPETPVYEVNVDSVSDYMDNLDAEVEEAEATPTPTATPEPTSTPAPTKEPTKTPAPTKMPKKKVKKEEKKAEPTPAEAAATPTAETPAAETPETPAPETPAAETPAAETPAPETPAAETPAPAATYATNDTVNFRTSPNKSATAIGMIGKDVQLTVLEDQTSHPGWYKISRNGTEGYVSADFVTTK